MSEPQTTLLKKLSDNLNLLMAQSRISASELARNINLPATTIKRIRNQDPVNPTLSSLLPIAQFFKLTLSQLVGDESLPLIKGQYYPGANSWGIIPILTWEQAITWETTITQPDLTSIMADHIASENAYALIVDEDHWENLAKGTNLIINPDRQPIHRDLAIVYKQGQTRASLKQVLFDDDKCYLKPINPNYQTTTYTELHQFLGVVTQYKLNLP